MPIYRVKAHLENPAERIENLEFIELLPVQERIPILSDFHAFHALCALDPFRVRAIKDPERAVSFVREPDTFLLPNSL
jgi:hypothetical protein